MGRALTLGLLVLLGSWVLAPPAGAAEAERVFLTDGYRYVPVSPRIDEATADIGLALCGTRCNALSGNYESYMMTMGWRLTKVEGVTERTVALGNPFLDGQCVCTGEEYTAEYYYYLPGGPPAPPGAKEPELGRSRAAGEPMSGRTR
ncbi:MAG: hypothetical protein HZB55_02415 [Deltaproteobacteria bacterium]|nr:hypothetical protein [Deltaproteobacteria bacterium]